MLFSCHKHCSQASLRVTFLLPFLGLCFLLPLFLSCKTRGFGQNSGAATTAQSPGALTADAVKQQVAGFRKETTMLPGIRTPFEVLVVPQGTRYFTWTTPENATRLIAQGHLDAGEMDFLRKKGSGVVGGGFYASLNPFDSQTYGSALVVTEVSTETRLLLCNDPRTIDCRTLGGANSPLIPGGLHGFARYMMSGTPGWTNFISSTVLQNIRAPRQDDFLVLRGVMNLEPVVRLGLDQAGVAPAASFLSRVITKPEQVCTMLYSHCAGGASLVPKKTLTTLVEAIPLTALGIAGSGSPNANLLCPLFFEDIQKKRLFSKKDGVLFPGATPLATISQGVTLGAPPQTPDAFLNNLLTAFEFIGVKEMAVAMAFHNGEPWKMYDTPGIDGLQRWRDTLQMIRGGIISGNVRTALPEITRQLSGRPMAFRDHLITAGGALDPQGNIILGDTSQGQGYFRVTEKELRTLQANRFLTVQFLPDPRPPRPSQKTFLVKYTYPSAANYQQYVTLLSGTLRQRLDSLQQAGALADPQSTAFRQATQALVEELTENIVGNNSTFLWEHAKSFLRYQSLMAVHPFEDFNGRTLRLCFRATAGFPLFLADWDTDLFLTPEEFVTAAYNGLKYWNQLKASYLKFFQQTPNGFRDYYKVPDLALILTPGLTPDYPQLSQVWQNLLQFVKTYQGEQNIQRKLRLNWVEDWRAQFAKSLARPAPP